MRRLRFVPLVLIVALMGCATLGVKPWNDRSPKEKASYFISIYNKQYNDTIRMANNPEITTAGRAVVRRKKALLTKMYVAVGTYNDVVVKGEIPTFMDEQAILDLINQLALEG